MDEVIKRTLDEGIRIITVGTQLDTSKKAIEVAEKYEGVYATVGVHPSHTHHHTLHVDENETIETREEKVDHEVYLELVHSSEKVVAIGEVGLDYYRLPKDETEALKVKDRQEEVARAALELADETGKPVVLHVRDAHKEMQKMLKKYVDQGRLKGKGVVHCFTGTLEEARGYHELGFLTSFTGIVTFPDKKNPEKITELQSVAKEVPLEFMMVETDAPYLAPVPHRGKRCEPWMVRFVAQKIAQLKGIDVAEVERITDENAEKLFGIGQY